MQAPCPLDRGWSTSCPRLSLRSVQAPHAPTCTANTAIQTFLAAVDSTIVASTSAKIGTDFDALNRTSWLATGYLLTKVCVEPLYGKLSDIYGRKPLLLLSFAIFALGCAVSGVAGSLPMLIFGRVGLVVCGVGYD